MKNLFFIFTILIVLFKTGNVLSDNKLFNVNNIEISKENYKNKQDLVNQAFQKGFKQLTLRLLLEEDHQKLLDINLKQIKKLVSYYQIIDPEDNTKENKIKINIFFDKDKIHDFFYQKNILYSDIINTEMILFPLLIINNEYFIFSKNYFYKNWNLKEKDPNNLIEYNLPLENVEIIQKIDLNKSHFNKIKISDFFKEYNQSNMAFAIIEINNDDAKIFLNTEISGKKLKKNLSIQKINMSEDQFNDQIILTIKNKLSDLVKLQNLIDVRTPSFLNVKIKLNNKGNLVEFRNRINKIDLLDDFYVKQLNKDYALVKIKYLGKISKIIKKLKSKNINLMMIQAQWQLEII